VTLHDEVLDAEAREKQRQRQPDQAAADDQNGDLLVGLDRTPTLYGAGARAKVGSIRPEPEGRGGAPPRPGGAG
jgi:hypothetical protein